MSTDIEAATPARRGRPPQISAEDIVAAATHQLANDWTVASVAAELGVSDAAIYRYFPSKKAILAAVAVRFFAELPTQAPDGDWRTLLSGTARYWYSLVVRFPAFLDLETWLGVEIDGAFESVERTLDALVRAGFDPVEGSIVLGTAVAVSREFARTAIEARRNNTTPRTVSWDTERFPTMSRASAGIPPTDDAVFECALGIVLDGAAQRLATGDRT